MENLFDAFFPIFSFARFVCGAQTATPCRDAMLSNLAIVFRERFFFLLCSSSVHFGHILLSLCAHLIGVARSQQHFSFFLIFFLLGFALFRFGWNSVFFLQTFPFLRRNLEINTFSCHLILSLRRDATLELSIINLMVQLTRRQGKYLTFRICQHLYHSKFQRFLNGPKGAKTKNNIF